MLVRLVKDDQLCLEAQFQEADASPLWVHVVRCEKGRP